MIETIIGVILVTLGIALLFVESFVHGWRNRPVGTPPKDEAVAVLANVVTDISKSRLLGVGLLLILLGLAALQVIKVDVSFGTAGSDEASANASPCSLIYNCVCPPQTSPTLIPSPTPTP